MRKEVKTGFDTQLHYFVMQTFHYEVMKFKKDLSHIEKSAIATQNIQIQKEKKLN